VAFSGRSDITAVMVGSFFILYVFQMITVQSQQAALVLMGAMMLATVMIAPQGFVVGVTRWIGRFMSRRGKGAG
jgi:urea transport system permease protein